MKGTYVFLADGFEVSEALTTVNMLRRGGINVKTVSIYDDRIVTSSNRIPVIADMAFGEFKASTTFGACLPSDVMIFPGGMPGSSNLAAFGKLIDGFDVLDRIAGVSTNWSDKPLKPQKMSSVTIVTE